MFEFLKESGTRPGFKAILIGCLLLIMMIPMMIVTDLVRERQARSDTARLEVGYAWGGRTQSIAGPFLVVP